MLMVAFLLHQSWQNVGISNLEPLNGCKTIELNRIWGHVFCATRKFSLPITEQYFHGASKGAVDSCGCSTSIAGISFWMTLVTYETDVFKNLVNQTGLRCSNGD
jgi:hypothetical protein